MTVQQAIKILTPSSLHQLERAYQEFYKLCETANFNQNTAEELSGFIIKKHHQSQNESEKSYCFLYLNALLDNCITNQATIKTIINFLISEIDNLKSFKVMDANDNFIHFINHAIFCADSLVKNTKISQAEVENLINALLNAYLRSNISFNFNEDILLAEFILKRNLSPAKFEFILAKLQPTQTKTQPSKAALITLVAKQTNKRSLWMAMLAMNQNFKIQDSKQFDGLIQSTIEEFFE